MRKRSLNIEKKSMFADLQAILRPTGFQPGVQKNFCETNTPLQIDNMRLWSWLMKSGP